jgi:hypothetical protein
MQTEAHHYLSVWAYLCIGVHGKKWCSVHVLGRVKLTCQALMLAIFLVAAVQWSGVSGPMATTVRAA